MTRPFIPVAPSSPNATSGATATEQAGDPHPSDSNLLGVIGIGATADGLTALHALLRGLGEHARDLAVIVQHHDLHGRHLLASELGGATSSPVLEAIDNTPLQPGHIYVAPPKATLSVAKGTLRCHLVDVPSGRHQPITALLCTLAEDLAERAVGIVLSGTGADGVAGLEAISSAGGLTLAQDGVSAVSAVAPHAPPGQADHVLAPAEMAEVILRFLRHARVLRPGDGDRLAKDVAAALPEICEILLRETRHDFKSYKTSTLLRRIQRRMQLLQLTSVSTYVAQLRDTPGECAALFRELLINVTAFFRDPDAFDVLAREVIPRLFRGHEGGEAVRIWVAGCATGEEAYTIAILVREHLAQLSNPPPVQIFATDIDSRALQVARDGIYPQSIAEQLTAERLHRFFVKKDDRYQVVKELREICLFSPHNVISDPPFSRLDLISCRNLLIYLSPSLQKRLIPIFHYALRPGGVLFLGPSENTSSCEELFTPLNTKLRLLLRRATTVIRRTERVFGRADSPRGGAPHHDAEAPSAPDVPALAQRVILDEFAPRYAVVNEDGKILCVSRGIARYLEPSPGTFHNDIRKMAKPGFRAGLHAALSEARTHKRTCVMDHLMVSTEQGDQPLRLTVRPLPEPVDGQVLYLVVFQDTGPLLSSEVDRGPRSALYALSLIDQLERELSTTREDLEKTIQDLELSNEELKSSNEELLSMNEELQAANEELEASKEEIQAINHAREQAHTDLANLFDSTRIATLFVDRTLLIRGFTPTVSEVYNVLAGDVGRPLQHITHRARWMPPLPTVDSLREGAAQEDELETEDGHSYMRRILPYRSQGGRLDGMVITFTDVTALRRSEREARAQAAELARRLAELRRAEIETARAQARLRLALDAGRMGTWHWDIASGSVTWDGCQYELFGVPRDTAPLTNELLFSRVYPADMERVTQAMAAQDHQNEAEFRVQHPDGQVLWLASKWRIQRDAEGRPVEMYGINFDITTQRQAKEELERTVRFADLLMGIVGHDLRNPLSAIRLNTGLLMRQPGSEVYERQVARIDRSALRMEEMISQLLDFTRARLGRGIPLSPEPLDLEELVHHACDELSGHDGVDQGREPRRIQQQLRGDLRGRWDRGRILQLLSNLLGNALQHRRGGEVRVTADGTAPDAIEVQVWNHGHIPAMLLPVLFDPLQGGERRRDEDARGLGLGLYISRQIVLAHGGEIRAMAERDGTTLWVRLPRSVVGRGADQGGVAFDTQ